MRIATQITWFVIRDILRSRWSLLHMLFFAAVTVGLIHFQGDGARVAISLSSVCLILIPLVSALYGSMYFYNSREFIELMLTQPVGRRTVFGGLFAGIVVSLLAGFVLGIGIPYLLMTDTGGSATSALLALLAIGTALTVIFVALSFLAAIRFDDRGRGLGVVLGIWLFAAIVYDGLILVLATAFSEYPLETPLLVASLVNPIDLSRVLLLIHSDLAALMGYTGAVFLRFFSEAIGLGVASLALTVWFLLPLGFGARSFARKDF